MKDVYQNEIKDILQNLQDVKECYENRKKNLIRKAPEDANNTDVPPVKAKKKKVDNVKDKTIIDTSSLLKKINEEPQQKQEEEQALGNLNIHTPVKEANVAEELMKSPVKEEEKDIKIIQDSAVKTNTLTSSSEKKTKDKVSSLNFFLLCLFN